MLVQHYDRDPMLLYVYRLRTRGARSTQAQMQLEGIRGDLELTHYDAGWRGRRSLLARVYAHGTRDEILPGLADVEILRIREVMLITGLEQVPRGRKGVDRYRQTWACAVTPIAPERWPGRPAAARGNSGFEPEDDDAPEPPDPPLYVGSP